MLNCFRQQNIIYKIITLAVLAAAFFFVFRIAYAGMRSLPYSRELLEPSNVALTNMFLEGRSPYTLSSMTCDVPGVNYDYPFLGSLIAAFISIITGCKPIMAHLVISFVSIVASGVIGALMIKDHAKTTVAPALVALLFMFCHWRFGYISAAPDDLGLLLMLSTYYITVNKRIEHKTIWCAIGITMCFYTKQYFVFAAVTVFVYMLLYSRREAIKLLIYTVLINAIVAVAITAFWPLFWLRTIGLTYLGTVFGGGGEISTLIEQLGYLVIPFAALFALVFIAAIMGLCKLKNSNARLRSIRVRENDAFALSVVNMLIMLAPLSVLGRNDGAFISYFLQLWLHSIVIVAIISFERMINDDRGALFAVLYVTISLFTIYFGLGKLPVHILTDEEIDNWEKAYSYTRKFSEEGEVFYGRILAYEYFETKSGDCLCGHDGELNEWTMYHIIEDDLPLKYFDHVEQLCNQNLTYQAGLKRKMEEHGYSLITLDLGGDFHLFDEEICVQNGYVHIDTIPLKVGNAPYEIAFYSVNCKQ